MPSRPSILRDVRGEVRPTLALAIPVVLGELAWMAMGVVDTAMVGRVSAEALGAMSIGRVLFMAVGVAGIGLLLGLDTLVSQAFGAGRLTDGRHSLVQAVWLSLILTVPLMLAYRGSLPALKVFGVDPAVIGQARGYVLAVGWAVLPLLLYNAFRRYLQAVSRVRPVMLALVSANAVNAFANWVLIFGKLGFPALGAAGAGWATLLSMIYMALFLLLVIAINRREAWADFTGDRLGLDWQRVRELFRLGLPAAIQLVLEVGVFALATVFAGKLPPASLAAHQIALIFASVTYMVPLGISSAGAVRVGQAIGRGEPHGAAVSGWTAIGAGGTFMAAAAVVFFLFPRPLIRLFSTDAEVVAVGATLILVAAVFQFFDGICVVAIGTLRGAGDTRTPAIWTVIGYWGVALPLGYWLGFGAGKGVLGLWIGLCAGLILVAILTVAMWVRKVTRLRAAAGLAVP